MAVTNSYPSKHFQTKLALGCDVTLVVVTGLPQAEVDEVFRQLWLTIYKFERRFSRFIPSSELSMFNKKAGTTNKISDEFRQLLLTSKELANKTNGLYNPFILPALHRVGYKQSLIDSYDQDAQDDYSSRAVVDPSSLEIGDDWAMIPYGTALDMGGCGKGYLADQLATLPFVNQLEGYWFSLGGDVVGAGNDEAGKVWNIYIQPAPGTIKEPQYFIQGQKSGFAIATSGTNVRRGTTPEGEWHHIIDPRTCKPAVTDTRLATVVCKTAVEADVLASCAIILGSKQALGYLKKWGSISAHIEFENSQSTVSHDSFGNMFQPTS